MISKSIRPVLATALAILIALSLMPVGFAYSGREPSPQSGATTRPRRGKNGEPVKKSTAIERERSAGTGEAQPADAGPPSRSKASEPLAEASPEEPQPSGREESAGSSQRSGELEPSQTGSRRDPPPFDRPPIGAQPSRQADPSARRQTPPADSIPSGSAPADPPASRQRPGADSGSSGGRPALKRSGYPADPGRDADNQGQGSGSRDKPVLRRPADPQPEYDRGAPQPAPGTRSDNAPPPGDDEPIKLDATLVNIPILVSDRSGRYIPRLTEKDFLLYEDGVQQEVAFFGDEEVPFSVALLLDVSPSVASRLNEIQDAAIEFVRQLRSDDRVMVVAFDRNVDVLTDFTSNRRSLEAAIRSTQTGSGTSVYDAVYEVVSHRFRNIEGRKALILFSDGEDTTSSQASYDEAIEIVAESDVLVYGLRYPNSGGVRVNPWPRSPVPNFPIPFPWPWPRRRRGPFTSLDAQMRMNGAPATAAQNWPRRNRGGDFMSDITTAGGGPVYDAEKISDLSRLASRVAEELRHVYSIGYYPTNSLSNGGYRTVRVRVRGRDDIGVRHRKGYNAREASGRRTT